jgi:translation elongation factor P/translation initiation factor 5A
MNSLKLGHFVVLKREYPCKVIEIAKSAPGKHGHAQYNVVGIDLLTDKKHNELFKHHDHYVSPTVSRTQFTGMTIDEDGYLSIFDEKDSERTDLKLTDETMAAEVRQLEEEYGEFQVEIMKIVMPHDGPTYERILSVSKVKTK